MEIKLTDEDKQLIISNEGFDNNNYINLKIGDVDIDCSIDEIYSAIKAFLILKRQQDETEKNYK